MPRLANKERDPESRQFHGPKIRKILKHRFGISFYKFVKTYAETEGKAPGRKPEPKHTGWGKIVPLPLSDSEREACKRFYLQHGDVGLVAHALSCSHTTAQAKLNRYAVDVIMPRLRAAGISLD